MATREAPVSDTDDPLNGLNGPLLFPRTIMASAHVPAEAEPKDLYSVNNFMKSLELRSPQKLFNEAKKIVDGGAELLESNLVGLTGNVNNSNAIAAKVRDKPQERRPGLGLARKRAPFSLKTSLSQPSVNLEPAFDIDHLQDPDEFFDAYEKNEKAKKEIEKQLDGSIGSIKQYKPSNRERHRRPGILGKSYNYKPRYMSMPAENDEMSMSSQETVSQDITSAPNDESQENLVLLDHNLDANLEEFELAVSVKKTESKLNDILEELLSCNDEDLEGDGALNLLQERLNIKPLDSENLCMTELPDFGRTNISTASESWQKSRKSSVDIDRVLKNLRWKPHKEQKQVPNPTNPVSSATPSSSPFASMSSLKKRILQSNPLRDPFSALDIDSECPIASPGHPKEKLLGQVDAPKDMGTSNELDSDAVVGNSEPPICNMDAPEVVENTASLLEQLVDENSSIPRTSSDSRLNAFPTQLNDKLLEQVDAPTGFGWSSELQSNAEVGKAEPTVSHKDLEKVIEDADGLPQQFIDENASIQNTIAGSRPNEESDNIMKPVNPNGNDSNPPVPEEEARDGTSSRQQIDPEQSPEVHAAKPHKRKRKAREKRIRNACPVRKNRAGRALPSVLEEEDNGVTSDIRQTDPEKLPEVHTAKSLTGKTVAGVKRIRDAHPMRKSLAEDGTSFENGVRRSKRIRSRPLEFWKGERFVYERVNNSLKLMGVRYLSPSGKENLKVKLYVSS